MRAFFGIVLTLCTHTALAAESTPQAPEEERDPAWRNEQPGWGVGLRYGPAGPGASLRGWSSAALSVDVDAGLQMRRVDASSEVWGQSATSAAWADVAPRIRVFGSEQVDVLVVPSARVTHIVSKVGENRSDLTEIRGALGIAVDRWIAPGVSITGRLDALQLGQSTAITEDVRETSRLIAFELTPTVAVHVYPRVGSRDRSP